jgi:hypothetical protein
MSYPKYYASTYCNKTHRMSDGKPVEHNCYILPPSALRLEYDGDYEAAIEVLQASKPMREMLRGVKRS